VAADPLTSTVDDIEDYLGRTYITPPNDLGIRVRAAFIIYYYYDDDDDNDKSVNAPLLSISSKHSLFLIDVAVWRAPRALLLAEEKYSHMVGFRIYIHTYIYI
jgi:hypothetical protein